MRLADAGIEEAVREILPHLLQLVPLAHRRGDNGDPRVFLHRLIDRRADGVGIGLGAAALQRQDRPFGADFFEDRRRVIGYGVFAGLLDVEHHGTTLVLDVAQPAAQAGQIMPVHRADVAEAQLLEQHSACEERLEPVADLVERLVGHAADKGHLAQQLAHVPLGVLIELGQAGAVERPGQAADTRTDRHLVVVEDDQQILAEAPGVVERFEDDAGRQSAVADDRDAVMIAVPEQLVAHFQPERAGDATAGMAGHEQVVGTFMRVRIAHQAAAGADGAEHRIATGDKLVGINLVAGVPDEAVAAEIESQVQGQAKLDDAQVAGEVSRPDTEHADQLVAHFLSELHELLVRELLKICGRHDPR